MSVWAGSEAAGVEHRSHYVVGEVAEAQGGEAEVFEAVVGLGGPVCWCPGAVEVDRTSEARRVKVRPRVISPVSGAGTSALTVLMIAAGAVLPAARVTVGADDALVDAPGGLDLHVALIGELLD